MVGEVVDEPGTDADGWSEIAGSFKDDDKVLYVIHSSEKDKTIEISDTSSTVYSQNIYVPACPRFRRTDDTRYMARRSIIPSNAYEMCLVTFIVAAEICIMLALSNFSGQQSTFAQRAWIVTWLFSGYLLGVMSYLWSFIWKHGTTHKRESGKLSLWVGGALFVYLACAVSLGAPAIGGFVVVSQMLKAYGICYKFV